ncbi:ribbon-helix-helix protein, CopG family [Candidatus Microgenomates bacterium]|nr:ribbon-helix-helix protein, CopG family [Candidatus Microgenomates bacterium]
MLKIQSLYMMTTINISLPLQMYKEAKKTLADRGYASVSELVREALRGYLYPKLTVNGFTPEFEDRVLKAAKEPIDNDLVFKTEKDIDDYFLHLKRKVKKNKK